MFNEILISIIIPPDWVLKYFIGILELRLYDTGLLKLK